jgi:ABC-2 type transport system ATP-binding protein
MKYAVEVRGLTKTYKSFRKKFKAVDNLSFNIKEGEIFGLLGPNGAGKTTTINMIIGILKKDGGKIKILGKDFDENKEELKNIMNVASAYHSLTFVLSVYENLKVYAKLYSVKDYKSKIDELLKEFGIEELKHKKISYLSSGEKTRVALCKALLNDPKILLLDECTVGLDPDISEKTRNYIKKYCSDNKITILFTSHYMFEVEELCDRIAFMSKGKIIKLDTAKNIKKMIKKEVIELNLLKDYPKVKEILKEKGLNIISYESNNLIFEINEKHNISEIIADILKNGIKIEDIHIKKPTLSDIFIKISRGER